MKFVIFPNHSKDSDYTVTKNMAQYVSSCGASVYMHISLKDELCELAGTVTFADENELYCDADFAVVIGGDGSILRAAKALYGKDIPIIGVNLGKVGYMAELERDDLSPIGDIISGRLPLEMQERMMLCVRVIRDGKDIYETVALNDVVVSKGPISRLIDVSLSRDGEKIADYRCDGIIASTPTGSTAYLMSAGGPVIDPSIECISVIPVCPYLCINSSPVIFSKDSSLTVRFSGKREKAYLNTDGEGGFELCDNDLIVVSRAQHPARLVRVRKTDFYKLLHTKLYRK